MGEAWDGIPEQAYKTGLHYITDAVALWDARKRKWWLMAKARAAPPEWLASQEWAIYRGPCPKHPDACND
jgi:hypothetical protein